MLTGNGGHGLPVIGGHGGYWEKVPGKNGGRVMRIWDWEMACLGKAGVDVEWAEVVADGGAAANSWMVRSCGVPNTYKEGILLPLYVVFAHPATSLRFLNMYLCCLTREGGQPLIVSRRP